MITEAQNYMDHYQATQLAAVEKYLMEELTPEVRDDFEEHFFDCEECAIDLRATAAFMDSASKEFKVNPAKKAGPSSSGKLRSFLSPSTTAWAALAASLLVIAYQNVIVYPHLTSEVAALHSPEVLPSVSLVGGNSRGGKIPAATVANGHPFLLLVDIPTENRFSSYTCLLYAPSGALSWQMSVSAPSAKDTVPISVPAADRQPGQYTLTVKGNLSAGGNPVELAHLPFNLNAN